MVPVATASTTHLIFAGIIHNTGEHITVCYEITEEEACVVPQTLSLLPLKAVMRDMGYPSALFFEAVVELV